MGPSFLRADRADRRFVTADHRGHLQALIEPLVCGDIASGLKPGQIRYTHVAQCQKAAWSTTLMIGRPADTDLNQSRPLYRRQRRATKDGDFSR